MAAIQVNLENIDLTKLYKDLSEKLPPYAVPLFIRISKNLEDTGVYFLH